MMLGAQARAAEYNAAKNASARQASREAEEQKLPPKPAPISLSAYTRNPQVNRNKGTKNWVPLVLEADEEEEAQPDESEQSTVSSKEHTSSSEPKQDTPSQPDSANRIRVNMPKNAVPDAPRAMRMQALRAQPLHYAPAMPHPRPVISDGGGYIPMALYAAPPGTQTVGMLPCPHYGWMSGLPMVDHAGHVTDNTPDGMRRYGGMMVPTDLTPTKQEHKLQMMSQAYRNPLFAGPDGHQYYDGRMIVNAPSLHQPYSNLSVMVQNPAGDYSLQPIHPNAPGVLHRPGPFHYNSDLTPEPKTAIFNPQPNLVRRTSLPEPMNNPVTPPRPVSHPGPEPSHTTVDNRENEEPYDRAKKMQKFIEAQQANAKTGKTVLNNPELRKSQEAKAEPTYVEDVKTTPTKTRDASTADSEMPGTPVPRTVPKIPPGLEDVNREPSFGDLLPVASQHNQDQALHELFGVGSDDWLNLKPVTRKDRKKMLSVMQYSTLGLGDQESSFKRSGKDPKCLEDIGGWLRTDTRGLQAARDRVDEIAADYSVRLNGNKAEEAVDDTEARVEDIHAGLVRGAGNVMATLTEYIAEREQKTEGMEQGYFNRTKPVPEFAIERVGLGANLGNLSLFEDEKSGFYNRPNRVARDPRFRPQLKEPVKVQSEEEWTARFKRAVGSGW